MENCDDVYHRGTFLKDLGKKLFAFSRIDVLTANELFAKVR